MADLSLITTALISGDTEQVCTLVQKEIEKGTQASDILNIGLIAGMDIVDLIHSYLLCICWP
ncbi:MAG: B12-binding domain-containing protein [Proteobacteria bacterium]|nr:B12-binding domain-containing protein [Pseudomonadota bacterium]MBU1584852.1 B12-binding domain-containing protein [Pseudomonadota bacterium]MBU2453755.1 B12-binding domain-containing protein [Pseudomonadota bacterium]MBU2630052.1 B12-binding domain-containing protein [Pseudomonadota bacterium]